MDESDLEDARTQREETRALDDLTELLIALYLVCLLSQAVFPKKKDFLCLFTRFPGTKDRINMHELLKSTVP